MDPAPLEPVNPWVQLEIAVCPIGPTPPLQRLPPTDLVPWPSEQLKSTLMPMRPAMAIVPDAKAQPKAVRPRFLIKFAFIVNLLPKMENQSFEKLLKVRRALLNQAFSLQQHL